MAKGKPKAQRGGLHASATHLLHRTLQLALEYHAEAAGTEALTQRQFTVLAAASQVEGLTQNDLVRATGIDRSTLADLVARLLVKGLLLRERSATDARANAVRLSDAGRNALEAGADAAARADQRLLGLLSAKKREAFMKVLGSLAAAADAPLAAGPVAGQPPKAGKKAKAKKAKKAGAGKSHAQPVDAAA
ncbi:MAG TPA: MarR family winged helix-turn-helix transcriptional regulator [Caulobacteraceae bacterium]|jgi:DNA-binding MarR family transcriptional regulator|nr:MarR family winged helix-turn-helix transcriptional regulator [Caulobacteraceae bacterium]